ncbi:hypothetical protein NE236_42025 [Actinoallomurus purpureus]|uniref:hypothetical protein n=1 Tax=Actinoallomurus purpureus TaxID=478114 RepID=UPI0020934F4D|nr:hypothetical protein [Actinoallomurus purpureus]MCO6011550.1 hypothetical protein [Actinoallomurus purpureus]
MADPIPVLPYPHARNDCGFCRERDADVELTGEHAAPAGKPPRRFCQRCLGVFLVSRAGLRDVPEVEDPFTVSFKLLPPDLRARTETSG